MNDAQWTPIPESFLGLHTGFRGRLLRPLAELQQRHELCEDLAQHLMTSAQGLYHDQGLDRDTVLERIQAGLESPESGLLDGEGAWVCRRLAELLRW